MTPPALNDNEGTDLAAWLKTVPGIPADFPRGVLTPEKQEDL